MKRSVAKRNPSVAMVAKLLSKGEAKDVAIKAGTAMMDAAMMTAARMAAAMKATAMMAAARMAAAMIAVAAITTAAMTSAAMIVPRAATGTMTNKAAQIIKGVAAAMIATLTGAAVVHTTLTTLRTLMQNHAAPLALDLLSAQEAVRTPRTQTDPANIMSLRDMKVHTYRHVTWK
jgi:hypothetical protein